MTRNFALGLVACLCLLLQGSAAQAQLGGYDFRLSLDTDVISAAGVSVDPEGPGGDSDTMVFGIGPNQLGGSQALIGATPLGLGLAFTLSPKIMFGARVGFGLDIVSPDGADDNAKVLALSLAPGLTIVPIGQRAKLFIQVAPLFQVNRIKETNDATQRVLLGGFSTGIGALIFAGSSISADIGFFFEGRFGGRKIETPGGADAEADVQDLRGVIRFGLSLWK